MPDNVEQQKQQDDRIVFLREFLKHPNQVASIIPSSRFLERRVMDQANVKTARMVVELGGGTGGTTRAILRELPPEGKLLVIEINARFCARLQAINDPRLIVHRGNAQDLQEAIATHGLPAPDAIISGIPFSTMGHDTGSRVLNAIKSVLPPGGCFVAYQFRKQVYELARPLLGRAARVELALLNIPPMRVFRWEQQPA
ncbi:MAG: methyltransferase domain-containing protein [Betaproteobacteria bacterium]|nr:methyltransferase domain-containing protein [Betaproteobacteria bacterium]